MIKKVQQKRYILKGISSHIIKCNNKAAKNKVLVHFYTAAGKPNEEKYRGTARKLRQSTDILGHCLSLNALI